MADGRESPSSARVRDLIFAYERHTSLTKPLEEYNGRPRAKSIGNALSYKLFREPNVEFYSIIDIEKELVKIEAHLNYYEVYEKETHVAFQEQLFNVLTSLVNIDPEDQEGTIQLKKKLILETQKLATDLNSRLPYDGSHSYKGARRTYSTYVRKEEAVVSTTSVKSHEHKAILSSHNSILQSSTLNGGFKSEESLNSTKDSVDLSSKQDESSIDFNYLEERPQSSPPPPQTKIVDETHSGIIPSVSKLKKFFSFRREAKPEIKVTSASYSGLSRSQSLNVKTNKNLVKKNKKGERKKEEVFSETDEIIDQADNQNISSTSSSKTITSSQTIHSTSQIVNTSQTSNLSQSIDATSQQGSQENSVHIEPVKEVEQYAEEHNEATLNVSVSKLKGLFEKNRNETNEGLGILTKKQTEFSSDLDLPFTAMNLGAYRLKRTISGNYMNFTGLIRNVDINKRGGDLSKSKSLSDLKITNYSYGAKDLEVDDELDLSKEIDDNDDFEHVSIDLETKNKELNNNIIKNGGVIKTVKTSKEPTIQEGIQLTIGSSSINEQLTQETSTSETNQTVRKEIGSIFLSKSVETLKQQFENLSVGSGLTSQETNEDVEQIVYKTKIEPVSNSTSTVVEPVLKVPIQLRPSVTNVSQTNVLENSNTFTVNKENIDNIGKVVHKTIEPISSSTDGLEEPKLKVPIQLRKGFVNIHSSQDKSSDISEVTESFIRNERVSHEISETVSSGGIVETLKQTYENISSTGSNDLNNKEVKHILHRTVDPISSNTRGVEEPVLKVPIQLRVGVGNVRRNQEVTENFESTNNEEIKHVLHKTIEPILSRTNDSEEPVLKVPIQLRTFAYDGISREIEESNKTISRNEVHNADIHRTIEPISSVDGLEEPVLKVPIQLRIGIAQESQSHETIIENTEVAETNAENSYTVQETTDSLASPGTVEVLTQTFENLSSINSSEVTNDEIKNIIHRTVEPIGSIDDSEEPVLKVPIQLRIGVAQESQSHETIIENTEVAETNAENSYTVQETTDSLASPGTVEVLTQTFENLSSINSSEVTNDEIKNIIHRTVEPIGSIDDSEEPVLKVPIQLRIGVAQESQSHEVTENTEVAEATTENSYTVQEASDSVASHGTVEILTHTFENLSFTNSSEVTNEEVKTNIHRTVEPIANADSLEEPVLKVPIQLRIGIAQESQSREALENTKVVETSTENSYTVQEASDSVASQGTVEILTQTFENISSSDSSEVNNADARQIIHRTIEPIPSNTGSSEEPVLKVPIQLRTYEGSSQETKGNISSISSIEANHDVKQVISKSEETVPRVPNSPRPVLTEPIRFRTGFAGSLEVVEDTDVSGVTEVFLLNERRHSDEITEHKTETSQQEVSQEYTQTQESILKVPIQLRIGNNITTSETSVSSGNTIIHEHEAVPIENVTFSHNNQDETLTSKDGSMSRTKIEEKTGSFVRVLESPSEHYSTVSSSFLSQSQQASSTKVSVSYSEKRTVQQTSSTHVSQRTVSSASSSSSLSSQQSGQSYLQVLKEPISYSLLRSINTESPKEDSALSITEVGGEVNTRRKIKVNLNVSQENIIDEILKEGDSLENIDEEFEKMLQENSK